MSDRDLGLANIRRVIERFRASSNATVEDEHTDPDGQPGNVVVWVHFGVGKRKRLYFSRGDIDDCRDGVSVSVEQKIGDAFRS